MEFSAVRIDSNYEVYAMTEKEMRALSEGDIVRSKLNGQAYAITYASISTVTGDYKIVGVRTVDISNPGEWEVAAIARYETPTSPAKS